MEKIFLPAKLLMSIVARGAGRNVVEAAKRGGARGGTKLLGRGADACETGGSSCEEGCCGHDIVIILMQDEAEDVVGAVVEGSFDQKTGYAGTAIVLDVPKTLLRCGPAPATAAADAHTTGGEAMQSGYTMISSIINHGQAEDLMAVAREAGARGGTILNARGTGTEDDVKFFGISLAPEKEFLVIIAENSCADAILEALSDQPVFSEPGGGIIFTTGVDRLISLGV